MHLRLYFDQDSMDQAVVAAIRSAGGDVLTSHEAGHQRLADPLQLAFAAGERRAVYTANRSDFARLHARWLSEGRTHWGIIIRTRQGISPSGQIRALLELGERLAPDEWQNHIAYI